MLITYLVKGDDVDDLLPLLQLPLGALHEPVVRAMCMYVVRCMI